MQNREIATHVAIPDDAMFKITADEQQQGNASHEYRMTYGIGGNITELVRLRFQQGPINEVGPNGVTNEMLLACVIDRLDGFQTSEYKNRFNADALVHLHYAMAALKQRTIERAARGVEGTSEV